MRFFSFVFTLLHFIFSKSVDDKTDQGTWRGIMDEDNEYDVSMSHALVDFFSTISHSPVSVVDFGSGLGRYSQALIQSGIFTSCYNGNPSIQSLSNGHCAVLDLSSPVNIKPHDWVLSLDVGGFIAQENEETFIKNLIRSSVKGIVLSWHKPSGNSGCAHRNVSTIRQAFASLGYKSNIPAEYRLRNASTSWFRDTIMVLELPRKLSNKVITQGRGNIKVKTADRDNEPPVVIPLNLDGSNEINLLLSRYEEPVAAALSVCIKYEVVLDSCAVLVTAAKEAHSTHFLPKRKYSPPGAPGPKEKTVEVDSQ